MLKSKEIITAGLWNKTTRKGKSETGDWVLSVVGGFHAACDDLKASKKV